MSGIGQVRLTIHIEQLRALGDAAPNRPVIKPCPGSSHWIEFVLVDYDGAPVPGQLYKIRLPDHSVRTGRTDAEGRVRFDAITAGQAAISFVDLDGRDWRAG